MIGTMNRIAGITALNGKIKVGMAWGARAESAESVAARLTSTVNGLDALDAASPGAWVESASRVSVDASQLDEFVAGEAFRDEVGTVLPDWGYHFSIDRRAAEGVPVLQVQVKAGSGHARTAGIWVNSVDLTFRGDRETSFAYFSENASAILELFVTAWAPDFAYAGTVPQVLATAPDRFGLPPVTAVTWLSGQFPVPERVPGAEVVDFAGGHLIYLGSAGLADSGVDAAVEVHRSLVAHGLPLAAPVQP